LHASPSGHRRSFSVKVAVGCCERHGCRSHGIELEFWAAATKERCTSYRSIFVINSAATFPGSSVGDGILARRASHTTHDIVSSQYGTRSPPLWRSRETVDVYYAHTGEEATGTQHIHPVTRFPSTIVIGS
jgi:hypothetical protein